MGRDCGFGRLEHGLRRLIALIGRPRFRHDTACDEYGLLERLALKGGGASNFGCWQATLIERNCCRKSDGCVGLRLLEYAPGKAAGERTQIVVVTTAGHGRQPGKARRRGEADVVAPRLRTDASRAKLRVPPDSNPA